MTSRSAASSTFFVVLWLFVLLVELLTVVLVAI